MLVVVILILIILVAPIIIFIIIMLRVVILILIMLVSVTKMKYGHSKHDNNSTNHYCYTTAQTAVTVCSTQTPPRSLACKPWRGFPGTCWQTSSSPPAAPSATPRLGPAIRRESSQTSLGNSNSVLRPKKRGSTRWQTKMASCGDCFLCRCRCEISTWKGQRR